MTNYLISTSTTCDLKPEIVSKNDIRLINFCFYIGDKEYEDDLGISYPYSKFYEDIKNGILPTTSLVNLERYKEYFRSLLKEGKDVLHIAFSSKLSGSFNNAYLAAQEVNEEFTNNIVLIDSKLASCAQGMLVELAVRNREKGLDINQNAANLEKIRDNIYVALCTSDIKHLLRGGRISKANAIIAGTLNIVPMIGINLEGALEPFKKCLGKKKAMLELVRDIDLRIDDDYKECYVLHTEAYDEALKLKEMILKKDPNINVKIGYIGNVIGSHLGCGALAIVYLAKEERKY